MATWSPLTNKVKESKDNSGNRKYKVTRITPHCWVGQVSIENGLNYFATTSRQVSSNYIIGADGRVGGCVREEYRAWTSSSRDNDNRAITIECASDTKSPYALKSAAYNKLVALCVDICKRYGKKKLLWFSDKSKRLSYKPADDEMVLTLHRDFTSTDCPGKYLLGKMPDLAKQVTAKLNPTPTPTPTPQPTPTPTPKGTKYKCTCKSGVNIRAGAGVGYKKVGAVNYGQIVTIYSQKNGWGNMTTSGNRWVCMKYFKKV